MTQPIQSTRSYAKITRAVRHYSRQFSSSQSRFRCFLSVCTPMLAVFPNHLRLLEGLNPLKIHASIPVLLLFALLQFPIESAHATSHLKKTANILVIAEAILLQTSFVYKQSDTRITELNWSANFSDHHWTTTISEHVSNRNWDFQLEINGFNWGREEEDLTVHYSGTGHLGELPVLVHGRAILVRNNEANDYQAMEFEHVTRIGNNSSWGWAAFAEVLVGVTVGGGAAVVAAAVAAASTGGLALGGAPAIVGMGAATGAATLVSISNGVKNLTSTSNDPLYPSQDPARPEIQDDGTILPNQDRVFVVMSDNGEIIGRAADGPFDLTGSYNFESGIANGRVFAPSDVQ